MINKSIVVLKALFDGFPVKIGNYTYCFSDNDELCIEAQKYTDGNESNKELILLKVDYSLNDFIKLCETLTDEEIFILGTNKVLTDLKRK
jgi:hypothetical protein